MSGNADTIRAESIKRVLRGQWADEEARTKALVATDALLAENQRLREALSCVDEYDDVVLIRGAVREALAGATE